MLTRDKIEIIMRKRNRSGDNLERDIQIVQSYFGLGNQIAPTYQTIADEFGGMTRERVRQIINDKFIQRVKEEDKDTLYEIEETLLQTPLIWIEELKRNLKKKGLADSGLHNQGLLNLFKTFHICKNYEAYTLDLEMSTRSDLERNNPLFLASIEVKNSLEEVFSQIQYVLGLHGIACLEKVFEQESLDRSILPFFRTLLSYSPKCWTFENQEGCWYLWEDRENVIFNVLGKAAFVTRVAPIQILSEILYHYINRRSLSCGPPTREVIAEYLKESVHTLQIEDNVELLIRKTILNDIEKDILRFYKETEKVDMAYNELRKFLQELGYQKPYYDIALFRSPFIYVDRSVGRGNYRLIILNAFGSENIYKKIEAQLKKLLTTDFSAEVRLRKEQHILREWLFKGKETEICAICQKLYNIRSLVCAHKKKRSYCTEEERTDPHIVMPLCLFGCDVMYEYGNLEIVKGKVVAHFDNLIKAEQEYVTKIAGLQIDARWLEGKSTYFERNYELKYY